MTDVNNINQEQVDSRVVKTVRNLKVHQTSHSKGGNSLNNSKDKTSGDSSNTMDEKNEIQNNVTLLKVKPNLINNNSTGGFTNMIPGRKKNRISIDGSEHSKESNNYNININNKPPKKLSSSLYQSAFASTGFRKTKSKYIQNLMSDMYIKKYKQSCIALLKNDNEVIKLYDECGFEKSNYSYERFIDQTFFENQMFLYKLEMLLTNNDNILVKKNYKEKFFKDEILKFLKNKVNENKYHMKIQSLEKSFESHYVFINSFDFVK